VSVRLDKWLWAARFFKTRTLAQKAIEGGKVHLNGTRTKPGHAISEGVMLEIRAGLEQYEVEVLALADKRGPASVARGLYRETEESKVRREKDALERKSAAMATPAREGKPDRYQRRRIEKLLRTKRWD
jgi:ribosome-associated heat shock protein Hsp15